MGVCVYAGFVFKTPQGYLTLLSLEEWLLQLPAFWFSIYEKTTRVTMQL